MFPVPPTEGDGYQRLTLGASEPRLAVARQRAARRRADVVEGADPQRERVETRRGRRPTPSPSTGSPSATLRSTPNPAKRRGAMMSSISNGHELSWGDRDAKSITRRDAIAVLDEIKATAPISANRTHSILVAFSTGRWRTNSRRNNPIAGLKKRAREKAKERALEDDELRLLWRALVAPDAISAEVADAFRTIL